MKKIPLLLTALSFGISHFAYAEFTAEEKSNIQEIVKGYLLENPEILYDMQNELMKKEASKQEKSLSDSLGIIHQDKNTPTLGNTENPKVILTEFMDYSCGYCRIMWPSLKKLSEKYPELQIKIVNIPILGETSELLADYSLVFWMEYPEKWEEFHDKILTSKARFTEDSLKKLVTSLDGDWDKLAQMVSDKVPFETLHQHVQIANSAGIQGTPFYAVDKDEFLPGAVGYEQLDKVIEKKLKP